MLILCLEVKVTTCGQTLSVQWYFH